MHPYAMRNGEPGEQAIALAAHDAGLAMLSHSQRAFAVENGLWVLPAYAHMPHVQIVGLARLRYRARTTATALWYGNAEEWAEWARCYESRRAEALGEAIATSTEYQRDINGRSTTR
jgi:hypothetical protein